MIVERIVERPDADLARALNEFEREFSYPLGAGASFRISHGRDYPRFFRSMGDGCCFVAKDDGRVVGTLGVSIWRLILPDGREKPVAYFGDLKVSRHVRGQVVLWQLARSVNAWAEPQVDAAFGVVMDGTPIDPRNYTGRVGIPSFVEMRKMQAVRFQTQPEPTVLRNGFRADATRGGECYLRLSRGRVRTAAASRRRRSQMPPVWLVHPDGSACGRLEDTRRAKRLFVADSGDEMRSAHLSCFAFSRPDAGMQLLCEARRLAARRGLPALFAALAERDMNLLTAEFGELDGHIAPATIYGTGLEAGIEWNINTSEI